MLRGFFMETCMVYGSWPQRLSYKVLLFGLPIKCGEVTLDKESLFGLALKCGEGGPRHGMGGG